MAVMMVVAMRPKGHSKKVKKFAAGVNRGFIAPCTNAGGSQLRLIPDSTPFGSLLSCYRRATGDGRSHLAPVSRACRPGGVVVHAHLQADGNAGLAVFQLLDANDLRDILAIHGIVRGGEGKRDEDAHAGIVGMEARGEINAGLRGIYADGQVLEVIVAGLGGAHADGPGNLSPAADAVVGHSLFELFWHGDFRVRIQL
jgi:hypothetical protein